MARRKDSMALFEAISKTKAKQGQVLPPHVGIQPQPAKAEPRTVLYTPPGQEGERPVTVATPTPAVPYGPVAPERVTPPPQAVVYEVPQATEPLPARVPGTFVLTRTHLAGAALLLVVVVGAVWWAARSGDDTPSDDAALVEKQPEHQGQANVQPLPTPPESFQPGKYYLVIERLGSGNADQENARKIAGWLNEQNLPAASVKNSRTGTWEVMAYRRFDDVPYRTVNNKVVYTQEAVDFARKIEGLGQQYFRQFGQYKFKQTNRDGELTPSYVKISQPQ